MGKGEGANKDKNMARAAHKTEVAKVDIKRLRLTKADADPVRVQADWDDSHGQGLAGGMLINYDDFERFDDGKVAKILALLQSPKKSVKMADETVKGWNRVRTTLLRHTGRD